MQASTRKAPIQSPSKEKKRKSKGTGYVFVDVYTGLYDVVKFAEFLADILRTSRSRQDPTTKSS